MKLKKYKGKRDFKKTSEPKGKVKPKRDGKLLYVVQKHAASHLHYDFRLELNGVLLSWAVPKGPCLDPAVKRLAVHVEDHPLDYGNFEGVIPKGQYGGGTVMLWDKGTWQPEDDNPEAAYKKGNLTFTLKGKKLHGRWKLIRINRDDKTWLLMKLKDDYAKSIRKYDVTKKEDGSVKSHTGMEAITLKHVHSKKAVKKSKVKVTKIKLSMKSSRFPAHISPQLAMLVSEPPEGKQWLHEIKLDGYRILAFKHKGKTSLISRNSKDWTKKITDIADIINTAAIPDVILDGEIVMLDDKQHSNFQLLQNSFKGKNDQPFYYYVFDLLYYDKYDLTSLPLIDRKKLLKKVVDTINDDQIRFSDHVVGSGKKVFDQSCRLGLEGIVAKDSDSAYFQKRADNWQKIKCIKRQEFVIGGFTPPQRSRQYFGSLLLGTFDEDKKLQYNGNVGTGFTQDSLKEIHQQLMKHKSSKMPFQHQPPASKNVTWVKPVLVCEVEFTEWTQQNSLRHPSFKGLRTDKPARLIVKETEAENTESPLIMPAKLTHPDKIIYKEGKIDKLQLAEYYQFVSKWILPYIENRLLTLVRCPNDYTKCFYQKHIDKKYSEYLHQMKDYFYIDDEQGLLILPQLGALEIHPWGSVVDDLEHPDMLIFDLDPAPGLPWKKVVAAALEIKAQLAHLKLKSFVKTTGGKGLHVVVPIKPEYTWAEVKNFARVFADYMRMNNPKDFVVTITKKERTGKILLDYLRNQRGATAVAPYSTRARMYAPVSTPLDWDELTNNKRDTDFTLKTIPERLENMRHDPWKEFFKVRQSLRIKELIKLK